MLISNDHFEGHSSSDSEFRIKCSFITTFPTLSIDVRNNHNRQDDNAVKRPQTKSEESTGLMLTGLDSLTHKKVTVTKKTT